MFNKKFLAFIPQYTCTRETEYKYLNNINDVEISHFSIN